MFADNSLAGDPKQIAVCVLPSDGPVTPSYIYIYCLYCIQYIHVGYIYVYNYALPREYFHIMKLVEIDFLELLL